MRPVERQTGDGRARGDERIEQPRDFRTNGVGQIGDAARQPRQRQPPLRAVEDDADRSEPDRPARELLAVAEPDRRKMDAQGV